MSSLNSGTVTALVSYALSRGLTPIEIEEAAKFKLHELLKPEARVSDDAMSNICLLLSERFPGEPFTLEMARAAPFSFFGGLADGTQFADDLRTAIALLTKNRAIIGNRLELYLREDASQASLVTDHPRNELDNGRSAEIGLALVARLFTDFLDVPDCVQRVTFAHKPHCDVSYYTDYFGAPVEFEAREIALVFKPEELDTPIKYANVELFRYVETHFDSVHKQIAVSNESQELTSLRKAAVENALRGHFGAASVAATANMSMRTAQRVTAAHGTTIHGLIENVRENRAKEFLSDSQIDIGSIALLLGYSDDRSFRRAFQRWTGQSPSDFRRAL